MSPYHRLETFRGVFHVLEHCELYVTVTDYVCVSFVFLLAFGGALLVLESRLVEVDVFAHDD